MSHNVFTFYSKDKSKYATGSVNTFYLRIYQSSNVLFNIDKMIDQEKMSTFLDMIFPLRDHSDHHGWINTNQDPLELYMLYFS